MTLVIGRGNNRSVHPIPCAEIIKRDIKAYGENGYKVFISNMITIMRNRGVKFGK